MSQDEVSLMFTDGWVCFRGFHPGTRAPMVLPTSLMPSVPTNSKSTWKNKDQRAAARAAKLTAQTAKAQMIKNAVIDQGPVGLLAMGGQTETSPPDAAIASNYPSPPNNVPLYASPMRFVKVPLSPDDVITPPPALLSEAAPQYHSVEQAVLFNASAPSTAVHTYHSQIYSDLHANIPGTPPMPSRKKKPRATPNSHAESHSTPIGNGILVPYEPGGPGKPKTLEALESKSGKGQQRRRSFGPIITASQRCGVCKPCMNPGWKKPCAVRRAEVMAAQQTILLQRSIEYSGGVGMVSPMQIPEASGK